LIVSGNSAPSVTPCPLQIGPIVMNTLTLYTAANASEPLEMYRNLTPLGEVRERAHTTQMRRTRLP